MGALRTKKDYANIEPTRDDLDPIPTGVYVTRIESTEQKATSKGDGWYLNFQFNVIEGNFANRRVYGMIVLESANAKAQEIGDHQMRDLLDAMGRGYNPTTEEFFLGAIVPIKVKIDPPQKEGGKGRNSVTAFGMRADKNWKIRPTATAPTQPAPTEFNKPKNTFF